MLSLPHRRKNPLNGKWVLCSPQRVLRPWNGEDSKSNMPPKGNSNATTSTPEIQQENDQALPDLPSHHHSCYLCPGNERSPSSSAQPLQNPVYTKPWIFRNDFPALVLVSSVSKDLPESHPLLQYTSPEETQGECHVIVYSANHSHTMAQLSVEEISHVIDAWCELFTNLTSPSHPECPDGSGKWVSMELPCHYVLIFENKGLLMGCSNPHPHGQSWSTKGFIPQEAYEEVQMCEKYWKERGQCMLCEYVEIESQSKKDCKNMDRNPSRVVFENSGFIVVVPYWAIWPYETLVLPKRHLQTFEDFKPKDKLTLAETLKKLLVIYDSLFQCSFPYSMGIHQIPDTALQLLESQVGTSAHHWHMHFNPPLLRNAYIKKFQVGFEMFGESQRDITPEMAAEHLRAFDC